MGAAAKRSKWSFKLVLECLSLGFLTACTPPPLTPTIAYKPIATDKTVVLLTPYIQPAPILTSIAPVTVIGVVGGIPGVIYDQSVQREHAHAFDALLIQQGFAAGPILEKDVARQLQAEGYQVKSFGVVRFWT